MRIAALVIGGLVVGQLAGCGSCVQDDPPAPTTSVDTKGNPRKPLDLRAVDKRLSQFSDADLGDTSMNAAGADASTAAPAAGD